MVDLLDINVWVALSVPTHPSHSRANQFWKEETNENLAFISHTMLGLVRILTNSTAMQGAHLSPEKAWNVYKAWLTDSAAIAVNEPKRAHLILNEFIQNDVIDSRSWSDAYLASVAISGSMRLVSFDVDFEKFPGLNWLHLVS